MASADGSDAFAGGAAETSPPALGLGWLRLTLDPAKFGSHHYRTTRAKGGLGSPKHLACKLFLTVITCSLGGIFHHRKQGTRMEPMLMWLTCVFRFHFLHSKIPHLISWEQE